MINLFRMDMYRLFRSVSFWIILAVMIALITFSIFSLWYMTTPEYLNALKTTQSESGVVVGITTSTGETSPEAAAQEQAALLNFDYLRYLGSVTISGGLIAIFVAIFVASFMASEFDTGFSKNVFVSQKNRLKFFASKCLTLLVIVLILFGVACVAGLIGALFAQFDFTAVPIGDVFLWLGLSILVLWAFSMLVAMLAWAFRTKVAPLVVGLLIGSGLISVLITAILSLIPPISSWGDYTLYASMTSLGQGLSSLDSSDITRIVCVGAVFSVLYSAIGAMLLKRKDI